MKIRAGALTLVIACAALAACTPELDWRELSVPEGRFAVLLPGKARHESRAISSAAGAHTMTMYAYSLKHGTMGVAYIDYPAAAVAAEQMAAARDALLRNIQGAVGSEEDIKVDGFPGRQVYAEGRAGARDALLKARFVVAGNRLYQIAYVGAKDGVAMTDIDMFLTSFKLLR